MKWFPRWLRLRLFTIVTTIGSLYFLLLGMLLVGALVRQINLLVALYGMLAGPLVLSWGLSRGALTKLRFRRRLPRSVEAGAPFVVAIEVTNDRPRLSTWALVLQDRVQRIGSTISPWRPSVLYSYVPAGQAHTESYRGQLVERGRYRLGPIQLSTRFPFGLLKSYISQSLEAELLVTPRLGSLSRLWQSRLAEALEIGEQGALGRVARDGEFFGLREWRSNDGRRAIHWRSSARRQTLIVRQFEQQRTLEVTVLLDLWQPSHPELAHRENVELAVSFAASLVAELGGRAGLNLRCLFRGHERVEIEGQASAGLAVTIAERLATLEADPHDGLGALLGDAMDTSRSGGVMILVTTRPPRLDDPGRFDEWWLTAERQAWLDKLLVVDVSQPELQRFFVVEGAAT
ncbi:MAG: DUF58 domain-containing protein [Planctomycetaceae bacterium]|nr:DUF58 domain-containing protein [Planctomycetaceae bacterium]